MSIIAPFWADVDTRSNGQVWYKEHSRNSDNFEKARENVMKYFCLDQFEPTIVFTVTWDRVPYYSLGLKVINCYKLLLLRRLCFSPMTVNYSYTTMCLA